MELLQYSIILQEFHVNLVLAVHRIMLRVRQCCSVTGEVMLCTLQISNCSLQGTFVTRGSPHILRSWWSVRDWSRCPLLAAAGCRMVVPSCLVTFLGLHPNFHLQSLFKILRAGTVFSFIIFFQYICVVPSTDGAELPAWLLGFNPRRQLTATRLLTPQRDGGENRKGKSEKTGGLR